MESKGKNNIQSFEIYSKRQKRLRGETPDVYQCKTIPQKLRVQVMHIWRDFWGTDGCSILFDGYEPYKFIHDKLCREYGLWQLSQNEDNTANSVFNFLLKEENTEKVIDAIEISFCHIDQWERHWLPKSPRPFPQHIIPDEAISELNRRFKEHGVGYQYESGQIIKIDCQVTHAEIVKPALNLLSGKDYKGANEEFRKAHRHYRKGRYTECLNECLKAFESCLKVICKKRGWSYDEKRNTAKGLIGIVLEHELIPDFMQSHFSGLMSTLESGLPPLRNRMAAHGQGSEEVTVPEYIAGYALHLTASNILLLAKADEHMKV